MTRADGTQFAQVVESLCAGAGERAGPLQRKRLDLPLPSGEAVKRAVEMLRSALFPGYYAAFHIPADNTRFYMGATLDEALRSLAEQIERSSCFFCDTAGERGCPNCRDRAEKTIHEFARTLPGMQKKLMTDVQAAYEGDPAATCPAEVVFCYPGLLAVTNHRIAHELYRLKVPLIPRMISELAHAATGIDIHPGAEIGESFFIDHGTGVVIGETATIGRRVRLYQGVTLGAKSFPLDAHGNPVKGIKRHPDVEDDVVIYAGATILGTVRIGKGATVGGNVWLTRDVAPGGRVSQADSDQLAARR
ncbi:MAG: serine acetyltransferase [Elusimicrobia bacterium]|nr:serine acetyltransferase [Elusimicrobiota bacterium]